MTKELNSGHDYGVLEDKFIRLVNKMEGQSNNRLRVYNKQIRRRRDNKRVLITFAFAIKNILPPEKVDFNFSSIEHSVIYI